METASERRNYLSQKKRKRRTREEDKERRNMEIIEK
jgi:hypothetical protein